jgi:hypothetical protein
MVLNHSLIKIIPAKAGAGMSGAAEVATLCHVL